MDGEGNFLEIKTAQLDISAVKAYQIERILAEPVGFVENGSVAFARWFRFEKCEERVNDAEEQVRIDEKTMSVDPTVQSTWIRQYGQISFDKLTCDATRPAKNRRGIAKKYTNHRRALEIYREVDEEGSKFYLFAGAFDEVKVNNHPFLWTGGKEESGEPYTIGPLPDFSVIQVEDSVCFFWKTKAALSFVTEDMKVLATYPMSSQGENPLELNVNSNKEVEAENRARQLAEEEARKRAEIEEEEDMALAQALEREMEGSQTFSSPLTPTEPETEEGRDPFLSSTPLGNDLGERLERTPPWTPDVDVVDVANPGVQKKETLEPIVPPEFIYQVQKDAYNALKERLRREAYSRKYADRSHPDNEKRMRRDWRRLFQQGIALHEQSRSEDPETQDVTKLTGTSNLLAEHVFLGIAPVWRGLREAEPPQRFAFADFNTMSLARSEPESPTDLCAVGGSDCDYLIPITLSEADSRRSPGLEKPKTLEISKAHSSAAQSAEARDWETEIGHLLFAVARFDGKRTVTSIIMDSCPYIERRRIQHAIEKIVRNSGWLKANLGGKSQQIDSPIVFRHSNRSVPRQDSTNSCGIFSILNAWAHMFGLDIVREEKRNGDPDDGITAAQFIRNALRMINLAMSGHMDSEVIQAFFNGYGYVELQDFDQKLTEMKSSAINENILFEILEEYRGIEMAEAQQGMNMENVQYRELARGQDNLPSEEGERSTEDEDNRTRELEEKERSALEEDNKTKGLEERKESLESDKSSESEESNRDWEDFKEKVFSEAKHGF